MTNRPASKRRLLTVVIVTRNNAAVLPVCFDRLAIALSGIDPEIVVVDNGSDDDWESIVEARCPTATIVRNSVNVGYAAAINAARWRSEGRDLLILDPEVRLDPGAVEGLWTAFQDPRVGIAVPRMRDADGRLSFTLRREPTLLRALGEAFLGRRLTRHVSWLGESILDSHAYDEPVDAAWGTSGVWLVSNDCLEAVGDWDQNLALQDVRIDFALRARNAGYVLRLVPSATAVHADGRADRGADGRPALIWSRYVLHRKHRGRCATLTLRFALLVGELLRIPHARSHLAAAWALLGNHPPPPPERSRDQLPPDYLCLSGFDWWYHSHAHADFQLMKHVARTRRVLFVNSIGLRLPLPGKTSQPFARIARKIRSSLRPLQTPDPTLPHLAVMTPISFPCVKLGFLRRLNAAAVGMQIRRALKIQGICRVTAVVCLPSFSDVVERLPVEKLIYYRYDKHSAIFPSSAHELRRLECRLLARADLVLHSSRQLLAEEKELTPASSVFFDHGVRSSFLNDTDKRTELVADLARIPHPRVGFIGTLRDYAVDLELLLRLARELPDVQIVIVGASQCDTSELGRLPNVHLLGPRPLEDVRAYGEGFDVALLPLHHNEFTRYQNPIKLKEYLALGLKVVSSDVPEVASYPEAIRIARDRDHFVSLVRESIAADDPRDGVNGGVAVALHSWEEQTEYFLSLVESNSSGRVSQDTAAETGSTQDSPLLKG